MHAKTALLYRGRHPVDTRPLFEAKKIRHLRPPQRLSLCPRSYDNNFTGAIYMFRSFRTFHKVFALLLMYGMAMPAASLAAEPAPTKKALTEDQKIMHVLNRLGFGARPGDVARVKAMGLQK